MNYETWILLGCLLDKQMVEACVFLNIYLSKTITVPLCFIFHFVL